ncbi:SPASM domain-containing protein [bacterium]|nr:SPASM domain-containing protein [candidate division CSSED10-310 bacterium]
MDVIWLNENPTISYPYSYRLRRNLNSWLISFQTRLKTERVFGYPRHVIVDLINVCGLKCPICPNGRGEIPRPPTRMTTDLFRRIMRTLGPYTYTLTLTNWGEPLNHPNLLDLLAIARKYPCYIGFSTNLQHLPDDLLDGLILSGLDEIGVSIDGATATTYNQYRVGGDFSLAMTHLRRLVDRRRELNSKKPKIRWQVLLNRFTENETTDIIDLAASTGVDSIMFIPILIDISRMFTHDPMDRLARDGQWLPETERFNAYDRRTGRLKGDPRFCPKLWDSVVIHPDGSMSPCCAVIDPKDDFGHFPHDNRFRSVWNGPSYRRARGRMAGRRKTPSGTVCEHCINHGVMIF